MYLDMLNTSDFRLDVLFAIPPYEEPGAFQVCEA